MRTRHILFGVLTAAAPLFAAPVAHAERQFAEAAMAHLALPYEPPCRVCHIQGTTGPGTLSTPFVMSLRAHGFDGDQASLVAALDALATDATDSDGDGVSDYDELLADRDPNTAAKVPLGPGGPTYGCATTAPAGNLGVVWLGLVVGGWTLRAKQRRRRPCPQTKTSA